MASSDDEEVVPQTVTNYHFVDGDESPISFSVLPVLVGDDEKQDAVNKAVYLHGTSDDGLLKVYKQVVAWKLGLDGSQPEIMVLSKDKKWINLLKPRKSYHEDTIRKIMITVQLLHFLRRKPQASEKSLWEHLRGVFSTFEVRPSEDDFREHLSLIKLFSERDEVLANSPLLLGFLEGKPRKRSSEDALDSLDIKQSFIADDDEVDEGTKDDVEDDDDSEDESALYDSVCAICDNGGDILCCEGPCLRSFHATREAGEESQCASLGYTTKSQVDSIQNFLCNNCLYKQHQCFACGKLGSSDKSKGAEVYRCVSATCGHFYHPKCVAEILFRGSEAKASEFQKKVVAGESFTCPVHKCIKCKEGEDKDDPDLQFAICRRCPTSYHKKCLPREIALEDKEDEDIIQRAWDDLLPNRILIYCLKHTIDEDLGTPIRNHIIFPENPEKKRVLDVQKKKVKALAKTKSLVRDEMVRDRTTVKSVKLTSLEENRSKHKVIRSIGQRVLGTEKKETMKGNSQSKLDAAEKTIVEDNKIHVKEAKRIIPTSSTKPVGKILRSSFPPIDSETESRVLALMEKTASSLSLEDVTRKRSMPSTHAYSTRHIDRTITQGKVEGSIQAIRTALQTLENGGSVADAKAVCEPEMVKQVLKWRDKLKVYLAPFLHGMRYTSFGRHFTKVDKLKQIVDRMQWYVQEGDTVVDFCCGANDFSILMKEKLDAAGKKCFFKNYDIIQPKNDFSFERRDWMKVNPKELPTGSKLIMGLNPPFGVKAGLANKFIDKALTFKPKLLILIVPKETERLDKKSTPYDLIWEDGESLSGKSFYLPGSVDVDDKQLEQWNLSPPPLYLWSRRDWTSKHKAIALHHGHIFIDEEPPAEKGGPVNRLENVLSAEDHTEGLLKGDAPLGGTQSTKEDGKGSEVSKKRVSAESHNGNCHKRRKKSKKKAKVSEERKEDELSDMSISPDQPENRSWTRSHLPLEPIETPSEKESNQDAYLNSENRSWTRSNLPSEPIETPSEKESNQDAYLNSENRSWTRSNLPLEPIETPSERASNQDAYLNSGKEYGMMTGGNDIFKDIVNDDIDEIARKYTSPAAGEGMFNHNSHNWPSGGNESYDYGVLGSESRHSDYTRDNNMDSFNRNTYFNDIHGYRRSSETDLRAQIRLYGAQDQDEWSRRNRTSLGAPDAGFGQSRLFPSSSHGHPTASSVTSAMDRYAPRLDETNYARPGSQAPIGPFSGRSAVYDYDIHGMRRDTPPNSMGFAPSRPPYPYPGGSGGWFDD